MSPSLVITKQRRSISSISRIKQITIVIGVVRGDQKTCLTRQGLRTRRTTFCIFFSMSNIVHLIISKSTSFKFNIIIFSLAKTPLCVGKDHILTEIPRIVCRQVCVILEIFPISHRVRTSFKIFF